MNIYYLIVALIVVAITAVIFLRIANGPKFKECPINHAIVVYETNSDGEHTILRTAVFPEPGLSVKSKEKWRTFNLKPLSINFNPIEQVKTKNGRIMDTMFTFEFFYPVKEPEKLNRVFTKFLDFERQQIEQAVYDIIVDVLIEVSGDWTDEEIEQRIADYVADVEAYTKKKFDSVNLILDKIVFPNPEK